MDDDEIMDMPPCWELAELTIPHVPRVLLYGPPGTGKTRAGFFTGSDHEKVFSLTMNPDMPAAEIRGHYIPNAEGGFTWHHGPGSRAWIEGARLVLNEIDRAGDDAMTLLYALLDDPTLARMTLPTGETIKPDRNFSVVATTNAEPSVMPDALQDRFTVKIHIDRPHPGALAKIQTTALRRLIFNSYVNESPENTLKVTMRQGLSYQYLATRIPPDKAAAAVFGSAASDVLIALSV